VSHWITSNGRTRRNLFESIDASEGLESAPGIYYLGLVAVNVIYELPFFRDKTTPSGKLLGGWQITEVSQFRLVRPFRFRRATILPGPVPAAGIPATRGTGFSTRWIVNGKIDQPAQFVGDEYPAADARHPHQPA